MEKKIEAGTEFSKPRRFMTQPIRLVFIKKAQSGIEIFSNID